MSQPAGADGPLARAGSLVDLGLQACAAYGRPDLATRLTAAKRSLADPGIHVAVVGEFKQGKSSLVNALLGAPVCPVDDDVATARATYVRHGETASAALLYDGDPPRREPIPFDQLRRHVVEGGSHLTATPADDAGQPAGQPAGQLAGVEVRIPRSMLAGGLVVVDTPGLGGLASMHAAASLTASATADALLFVTDASQELTASELDFLRRARDLCPAVLCVLTKTDFYPAWRKVRDLDAEHLARELPDVGLVAVSSTLRSMAVRAKDSELNAESGFPALVRFVGDRVKDGGLDRMAAAAAGEVLAVCDQLKLSLESERTLLVDPELASAVVDELTRTKQRAEQLKTAAARWNQTLQDGIADLNADIDHDLRRRIRVMTAEADEAIESADPADSWPELESWLESRTSYELVANYTYLRSRALALSELVGEHFRDGSGDVLQQVRVYDPSMVLDSQQIEHKVKLERMTVGKQTMVALRNSYSGILMFTMLGGLANISLGPVGIAIGLVMGHKGLRDEKHRQREQRRAQARNAVRRYCDEVHFAIGKDSRDTLRRVQRQLRDHYGTRAEELNRSTAEALRSAGDNAQRSKAEREQRLRDVEAELARLRKLADRAAGVGREVPR
jgi:uncharacterized membrane-anchored protein YhcB (DUF1043 family)